jgi:multiple sugar transport system ATP-binding protein
MLWPSDRPKVDVLVDATEQLGTEVNAIFTVEASQPEILGTAVEHSGSEGRMPLSEGAPGGTSFIARLDARTTAAPGAQLTLSVEPTDLSFFDPDTGGSLSAIHRAGGSGNEPPRDSHVVA